MGHTRGGMPRAMATCRSAARLVATCVGTAEAKSKAANRRTQSLDREVKAKRAECESALRDDPVCTTSAIEMDNCVLRCVSGRCCEAVYGGDALEEGEIDVKRGRTFRSCARTELRE